MNITRAQWGARPPKSVQRRDLAAITAVVFHYADAPAVTADLADEAAMVRSIQNFHMETRGWADIAYHALVGMSGNVYQGRRIENVGAHCLDFNTPSIGVCFLTNKGFSLAAGAAAVQWVQLVEFAALHRKLDVFAHREKTSTGCPGDLIEGWVSSVRKPGGQLAR